jgi:hypothetical protein
MDISDLPREEARRRVIEAMPIAQDGKTMYPFKELFPSWPQHNNPDNALPLDEAGEDTARPELPLAETIAAGLCTASELDKMELVLRRKLLGEFFREGDLGFIFAPRGVAKTWFTLGMTGAIARASSFGPWRSETETAASVLYIDSEMPAEELRDRVRGLNLASDNLCLINHEILFERTGIVSQPRQFRATAGDIRSLRCAENQSSGS